ncbi:MAG: DUF4156 domain-containing protein [Desulfobacteraceae bacterium]|nr:DUF4156 domain-containing protein [Desulfobacteraceae bacterium]
MKKTIMFPVCILLLATGCTWVKLTRNGDNVRIVSVSDTQGCKNIGQAKVSVRDNLLGDLKRDPNAVARELMTLGRNSAAEMNGDTITPASGIVNGEQSFNVYKCMP